MSQTNLKRTSEYKPLLFTTTVRNPRRMRGLLNSLFEFNGQMLSDDIATKVMSKLMKYGLYRPMKQLDSIKVKWKGTKRGDFANIVLTDEEVSWLLKNNPQEHKEAGFDRGWPSRFATEYDFAKELGFVYFWPGENIFFSKIGIDLAHSINVKVEEEYVIVEDKDSEIEQKAFLNAFVKYQNNNPFKRVLNENVPLILLLEVITKLKNDKDFNNSGISKLELPLVIFWKNSDSEALYKMIKELRNKYKYLPSWEVVVDLCVNKIMDGKFKKFKPESIMVDYPDDFIRKMRLTGLITLRGGGRFIDINENERKKVDYALKNYSTYKKFKTEKDYFDYMSQLDENLISSESKKIDINEGDILLKKWVEYFSWEQIKTELNILSSKGLSKDNILKFLSSPTRLEFLIAIAVKSKFPDIKVVPNYRYDDEGLPTGTAAGYGDKGDIECLENKNGILIEVTLLEGGIQTKMEVWPISRHLEEYINKTGKSMCYFIAPSIYKDSIRQIDFVRKEDNLNIYPKTINDFVAFLETEKILYKEN